MSDDLRYVADDITNVMQWDAHPPGLMHPLMSQAVLPVLVPGAFDDCHTGVEVGYFTASESRTYYSVPSPVQSKSHTLAVVVKAKAFDAMMSTGSGGTPGIMFLGGAGAANQNSALGFNVNNPADVKPWFSGFGQTNLNGMSSVIENQAYILVKTYDSSNDHVFGYVNGEAVVAGMLPYGPLADDVGIGGHFEGPTVAGTVGLQCIVGEVVVLHRALSASDVKLVSCTLAKTYGIALTSVCP